MKRGDILKVAFISLFIFSSSPVFALKVCLENLRKIASAKLDFNGKPSLISPVVILQRGERVLLGKRKSSQTWGFPGGALESFDRTLEDGAIREVKEETGLDIKNLRFLGMLQEFVEERQRNYFVMIFMAETVDSSPAQILEPEKHTEWGWFLPQELPTPLFEPNRNFLASYLNPFKTRSIAR